ncbi:hypothetical protein [Niveibacterium sp.]|uniref:hypothetical protein n=1 Tax=Niveibacterium sp. TaxID=2017444 RepID=UPI0035AE239E
MTHPTTQTMSAALLLALLALSACRDQAPTPAQKAAIEQGNAAVAYWENKCKTVAGEKIYRKVEGVQGILLLKVRPKAWENEWHDRNFPGAAFARERQESEYIESFLGYEHSSAPDGKTPVSAADRGFVNTDFLPQNPSNEPGYRYVDVIDEKDETRYRYSGSIKAVSKKDSVAWKAELEKDPNFDMNTYRWTLDKAVAPDPAPRYAVTYDDHVIPEERALGVASSTLKVIDTQTKEVLGELTRYAVTGGFEAQTSTSPWLRARYCPSFTGGSSSATRQFVDQVLIPQKNSAQ